MADLPVKGTIDVTLSDSSGLNKVTVTNNRLDVNGVFSPSNKNISSDSKKINITTGGGINSSTHKIEMLSEGNIYTPSILHSFGTSTSKVMQMFRASANNVHKINFVATLNNVTSSQISSFDSISGEWVTSDSTNLAIAQETTIKQEGTGSLKTTVKHHANGETITKTMTATDFSSASFVQFYKRSSALDHSFKLVFSDGINFLESPVFSNNATNTFELFTLNISDFTEGGVGTTDMTSITSIYFEVVTDPNNDTTVYFDDLECIGAINPETLTCQLYDFGSTSAPTNLSSGTLLTLDDSTTSSSIVINRVETHNYELSIVRGITTGNELTLGNYYGLVIDGKNVDLYGSSTQKYQSADFYTLDSSDNTTAQTASMMFGVYFVPTHTLKKVILQSNNEGFDSEIYIQMVDINCSIIGQVVDDLKFYNERLIEIDMSSNVKSLDKQKGYSVVVLHDSQSNATQFRVNYIFEYAPFTRYG